MADSASTEASSEELSVASSPARGVVATPWTYERTGGHFDEMVDAAGAVRPHWRTLRDELNEIGPEEFERRWARGRQLIHENGVTYNVYGDERGLDRPWQLDPIPMVISAAEWKRLERGVAQRATLLNAVLADLYGRQNLLRDGHLPATQVYSQRAFLKPLHDVPVPRGTFLNLYAVDLARAPDGQWRVINDRTQAPSGMGYALENRLVLTRTLPDVFRDCRVTRVAEFFGHLHESVRTLAPSRRDNPRIVLLTPGPYNETYFEHAYLARYLGYTLAEAGDLTVRDGHVLLKTLDGLLPVDVILRRTDDSFCDPLELREDSVLGVAGLVQAVRAGTVAIANALGSGLAQSPGLAPFLPGLCRHLLGEELQLPTVATWWCGQPGPMEDVIRNLRSLVIKPAAAERSAEPLFGERMDEARRSELVGRIRRAPRDYVAQEQLRLSTSPAWDNGALTPRHLMMRLFAAARPDGSWTVLPGGLTRISASSEANVVSMQRGGGSKDTWVISDGPVSPHSPLRPPGAPVEVSRAGFVLSSRIADNLYWLGRYMERIDFGVRVFRAVLRRFLTDGNASPVSGLVEVLSGRIPTDEKWTRMSLEVRIVEQLFGEPETPHHPCSVRYDVEQAHRIASVVRDRISDDAWRIVSRLSDEFVKPVASAGWRLNQIADLLDRSMITLAAFAGQASEGLTHEKGWRFLDTGRRLERSVHLSDLLAWGFAEKERQEANRLEAILDVANSSMTYRSRYLTTVQPAPVLDLLLVDEMNPRSLAFQLAALLDHATYLPHEPNPAEVSPDRRLLMRLLTDVRLADVEAMVEPPGKLLVQLLVRLGAQLPELSDILVKKYLSHVKIRRQSSPDVAVTKDEK